MKRIAFIVSHPIQYIAPLYQRLAQRGDIAVKVFFTWHAAERPVVDPGFGAAIKWDIPIVSGYDYELVKNVAASPGTHSFRGLNNPELLDRVVAWNPDVVHITGWAWLSHLQALYGLRRRGVPTLFRGDSHLLDRTSRWRFLLKSRVLRTVYSWPTAFLAVGKANRAYYEAFGVPQSKLWSCPHYIDVRRFASPADELDQAAQMWRRQLSIPDDSLVIVFAGKFENKKRPIQLMRASQALNMPQLMLLMVGDGELSEQVRTVAASDPSRFRVLPFQNQSRMPMVYRLGDLFILPSAYGETWGLAVNEAMACGRAVLASDRVGCAADLVKADCGRVFSWEEPNSLPETLAELCADRRRLKAMGEAAKQRARTFDVAVAEAALMRCTDEILR